MPEQKTCAGGLNAAGEKTNCASRLHARKSFLGKKHQRFGSPA